MNTIEDVRHLLDEKPLTTKPLMQLKWNPLVKRMVAAVERRKKRKGKPKPTVAAKIAHKTVRHERQVQAHQDAQAAAAAAQRSFGDI